MVTGSLLLACTSQQNSLESVLTKSAQLEEQEQIYDAIIELKAFLQDQPNASQARRRLGELYLSLTDGTYAYKELSKAVETGAPATEIEPLLVRALLYSGKTEEAFPRAEALAKAAPTASNLALFGNAKMARKDGTASELYEQSLKQAPDNVDALVGLALLAQGRGDNEHALDQIAKAQAAAPHDAWVLRARGNIEYDLRKYADALVSFEHSAKINPNNIGSHIGAVRALMAQNKIAEAALRLDLASKQFPDNYVVTFYSGINLYLARDYGRAIDRFREVLSVNPNHGRSQLFLGELMYRAGNLSQAEDYLQRFVHQYPSYPPGLKLLAATQMEMNKVGDSLNTLKSLKSEENDAGLEALRATALLRAGEFDQGVSSLQKAVEIDPSNAANRTTLFLTKLYHASPNATLDELTTDGNLKDVDADSPLLKVYALLYKRQWDHALEAIDKLGETEVNDALTWNAKALIYIGKEDEIAARAAFSKALEADADNPGILRNAILFEFNAGHSETATELNRQLLKTLPEDPFGLTIAGRLAQGANRTDEAIALYERARVLDSQAVEPRLRLAGIYFSRQIFDRSFVVANELAMKQPNQLEPLLLLGHSLINLGRTEEAGLAAARAVTIAPKDAAALYLSARTYFNSSHYPDAKKALDAVLAAAPDNTEALSLLASTHLQMHNVAEAKKSVRQLEVVEKQSPRVSELWGDIAVSQGDIPQGVERYRGALAGAETDGLALKMHRALLAVGKADEAVDFMQDYMLRHPKFVDGALELARTHVIRKDVDAAIHAYQSAAKLSPKSAVILNNLATLKFERGDEDALGVAERAYALDPENPYVLDTLGWMLLKTDKKEQALGMIKKSADQLSDNGEVLFHLGTVYLQSGNLADAREAFLKARNSNKLQSKQEVEDILGRLKQ